MSVVVWKGLQVRWFGKEFPKPPFSSPCPMPSPPSLLKKKLKVSTEFGLYQVPCGLYL